MLSEKCSAVQTEDAEHNKVLSVLKNILNFLTATLHKQTFRVCLKTDYLYSSS